MLALGALSLLLSWRPVVQDWVVLILLGALQLLLLLLPLLLLCSAKAAALPTELAS